MNRVIPNRFIRRVPYVSTPCMALFFSSASPQTGERLQARAPRHCRQQPSDRPPHRRQWILRKTDHICPLRFCLPNPFDRLLKVLLHIRSNPHLCQCQFQSYHLFRSRSLCRHYNVNLPTMLANSFESPSDSSAMSLACPASPTISTVFSAISVTPTADSPTVILIPLIASLIE